MDKYKLQATDAAAKKVRYRNDNDVVIALGYYGRETTARMTQFSYCFFDETTKETVELKFVGGKDSKPRYLAELVVRQWHGAYDNENPDNVNACISVPIYYESLSSLGMQSAEAWKLLFPPLRRHFRAIIFGCEDAEGSFKSNLTQQRYCESSEHQDPDGWLNGPTDGLSFTMSVFPRSVIFSPVQFLRTVGIPVTGASVEKLWSGTRPHNYDGKVTSPVDSRRSVLCLSEATQDVKHILTSEDYEFRVLTNIRSTSGFSHDELGAMSTINGSLMSDYLEACVHTMYDAQTMHSDYLRDNDDKIPSDHIIRQREFMKTSDENYYYVFAIKLSLLKSEVDDFKAAAASLGVSDLFHIESAGADGTKALEGPSSPKRSREDEETTQQPPAKVQRTERAKSPLGLLEEEVDDIENMFDDADAMEFDV